MVDDFGKKGRDVSPTQQELEFLFSLMARGLTPKQIVDEYQDTEFPLRQHRWVTEKQRYFDAARRVLGESIKAAQDPLMIEARRKHFEDLCEVMRRVERAITLLTDDLVDEGYEDGRKIEHWLNGLETCEGALSETDRKDTYLNEKISGDVLNSISISIEAHPLFDCLANHLEPKTWELFIRWKETLKQLYQQYLYSKLKDRRYNEESIYQMYRQQSENCDKLLIYFGRARYKGVFAGKCEACP